MSHVTQRNQTRNQITSDYDFSKIFLFENKYRSISITPSGADLEITAGMVIGVVDDEYQEYKSGTSDISIVGIAAETLTIADGVEGSFNICTAGKVAEEKITLNGTDTLDTVVGNTPIRDLIARQTIGIEIQSATQLSKFDN